MCPQYQQHYLKRRQCIRCCLLDDPPAIGQPRLALVIAEAAGQTGAEHNRTYHGYANLMRNQ